MSAVSKPQFLFSSEGHAQNSEDSHRMLMDDLQISAGSVSI